MDWNTELDACKTALNVPSDYALAKAWKVNNGRIAEIRRGEREPDNYLITRISLTLGKDPFSELVQQEARTEKNEDRRGWWRDFLSSSGGVLAILLGVLLTFGGSSRPASAGQDREEVLNVYYVKS